jgi:hypothetical protein
MENMIDVITRKCSHNGCDIIPNYNYRDKKVGLYCKDHKLDDMIDVKNRSCAQNGCTTQPSYNYKGEKQTLYCKEHKLDNMIDIKNKKCTHEDCTIRPTFNYIGEKVGLYCKDHKLDDMIDVINKTCAQNGCTTHPNYNYDGKKGLFCYEHKEDNMVNVVTPKCIECKQTITSNPKYKNHCLFCFVNKFPDEPNTRNYKTKEKYVLDALTNLLCNFINVDAIIRDKALSACSRRRPDFFYDCLSHCIIVENDENSHAAYDTTCDNKRMCELYQDVGHRPIIFIKFNCDSYTIDNKKHESLFKTEQKSGCIVIRNKKEFDVRIKTLYVSFMKHLNNIPEKSITVESLYYSE